MTDVFRWKNIVDGLKNKVLKYLLPIGAAVVLLYFSFRGINWADFMDGLGHCRWAWILAAMACGVLSFWLRALRWRELLLPIDRSTTVRTSFNAINIGLLANLALPRVGEFVRCGFVARHSDREGGQRAASYDKVLGTVAMERSLDVLTLLSLVAVVFFSMRRRFGGFLQDNIIDPLTLRFGSCLWVVFACSACAFVLVLWGLRHFRKTGAGSTMYRFASGFVQGLASCFRMKRWWLFIAYTVLIWTMYWMMSFTVLKSVQGMDAASLSADLSGAVEALSRLGGTDALFLMLAGSLSSLVPVPGGFGAFHYIVASALSTIYGVPFGAGIMFATLSHESQTVTQIICGGLSYMYEARFLVSRR